MGPAPQIARHCRVAAVAAACLLAAGGAGETAAAAQAQRLRLRPLTPAASSGISFFHPRARDRFRVSVFRPRTAGRAQASATQTRFRTQDGYEIPVAVSSAYTPDPAVEQGYVNFLDGLVHGSELGKISIYIATPGQIENSFCGHDALACYVGQDERMYVPGVNEHSDPPVQFLIAHEYGHHIELNRSNSPWSAYDQGAKRWATYENVCVLERRHRVRTNYYNDPSEAFAESYADMQFPGIDFIYTDLLAPGEGAFRTIRADVVHPWHGPRSLALSGTFPDHGHATRSFEAHTPLDGTATFNLTAAIGASYRLHVLVAGRAIKLRSARRSYTICGARTVTVDVTRVSGSGPFTVTASLP